MISHSSNPTFNDSNLIDLELRCNGQSDAFLDDLDFILDEDVSVAGDEVGILANHSSTSSRPSSSQESDAMDIQEFDVDDTINNMSCGLNSYHISHLCQSDVYEVELTPLDQLRQRQQQDDLTHCFRPSANGAQFSDATYNEALQKLAESMQRTEETRRQVILQRQILMPTPQQAQTPRMQQPPLPSRERVDAGRSISPGRSSILNAFFSGSRCTLTNGLDQSRKQLSMYMTQMNQQTF